MTSHKRGRQSFILSPMPVITHWASVAGKKESTGPLASTFDVTSMLENGGKNVISAVVTTGWWNGNVVQYMMPPEKIFHNSYNFAMPFLLILTERLLPTREG